MNVKKLTIVFILLPLFLQDRIVSAAEVKGIDVNVSATVRVTDLAFTLYPEKRIPIANNWHTIVDFKLIDPNTNIIVLSKQALVNDFGLGSVHINDYEAISPGNYNIIIKGISHIAKKYNNINITSIVGYFDLTPYGFLRAGDLNNDNFVNALDISILVGKLSTSDYKSDLNQDTKVNSLDLSILLDNLDQSGDA